MIVPYWIQDSIFYQIFPDRFANGNPRLNPPNVQPWGSQPTIRGFQGGDFRGILNQFDYLLDLGINAIYLNPIFQSPSNHRYNTVDYFKIDPKLGELSDFKAFLSTAHNNGVRVILDGVFNHCGRGFFAFNDILENGIDSPYRDWFHIRKFPVNAYSQGDATDYTGWWNYKSLPKLNTANQEVRKYLLSVGKYWVDLGIDGWRLDVPNEIDDDNFWDDFRTVVKSSNPDAYILGEIWDGNPRWVSEGHCDGLMNYPLREAIIGFVTEKLSAEQFGDRLEKMSGMYEKENVFAMYNLLGSHDTERILNMVGGDMHRVQLAALLQFAFQGTPAIYYGDEIGLDGGKDPECRKAFSWDQSSWKSELRTWFRILIDSRKRNPGLRRGSYQKVGSDEQKLTFSFARVLGDETVVVVVNVSKIRKTLRLKVSQLGWPDGRIVRNLLGPGEFFVDGEYINLTLPPLTGLWLK